MATFLAPEFFFRTHLIWKEELIYITENVWETDKGIIEGLDYSVVNETDCRQKKTHQTLLTGMIYPMFSALSRVSNAIPITLSSWRAGPPLFPLFIAASIWSQI